MISQSLLPGKRRWSRVGTAVACAGIAWSLWGGEPPALLGRWRLDAKAWETGRVRDEAGHCDGVFQGKAGLLRTNGFEAVSFEGEGHVRLAPAAREVRDALPRRAFTVEAWVALRRGTAWGGLLSVVQDNGDAEKGWVLGYNERHFTFAVATEGADDGNGRLTYLAARPRFERRRWHHVAGVYDGVEQRIYVDGDLAGSSRVQSGDLLYDAGAPWVLGAYQDANEFYPMDGWLHEVRLYRGALSGETIARHAQARPPGMPLMMPALPEPAGYLARRESPFGRRRVLIIGLDGCRVDSLQRARMPTLQRWMSQGAFSLAARATEGQPTISGPGWSSLLCGVWAEKHGVLDNDFRQPRYDRYPHFSRRIRQRVPGARLASIAHWAPINIHILRDADFARAGLGIDGTTRAARRCLREVAPDVLFVHYDQPDGAGHAGGYHPGNPNYLETLADLDEELARLFEVVQERTAAWGEQWLICLVSDHGGTERGSHGGLSLEERLVPFVLHGPGVQPGEIQPPPANVDLVPTVLHYLGIAVDPAWELDGRVVGFAP